MDDGVTVRRATPADAAAIVALNAAWNGADAGVEVAATLGSPAIGPPAFVVAADGPQVVSTVGLLAARLDVDGTAVPVGQPEFVATDPAHRGRGLVRRQFRLVEQWSAERGDLVQIVAGIRFFYRQLGYHYAIRGAVNRFVPAEAPVAPVEGWEVRTATTADLADVRRLQAAVQRASTLQVSFSEEETWPILLELPHVPIVVAEREGRIDGTARVAVRDGRVHLVHAAAASAGAARALLDHARLEQPGAPTVVADRPGSAFSAVLASVSYPLPRRPWLYVRVGDPVALLDHLRPVLSRRLAASPLAEAGTMILSLYRSRIGLELAGDGTCTAVWGHDGVHDDDDVAAVPPDLFAELVFGPGGAAGLEAHPDVEYGRHRGLMHVLFPPLTTDVLVW